MNNYKAKAEQWDELEGWAGHGSTVACILELRHRVMALEAKRSDTDDILVYHSLLAAQSQGKAVFHGKAAAKATPPPVATDEELDDTWNEITGLTFVSRCRAVYDLGVAHGQARSQEVAEPAPVAPSLKEQALEALAYLQEDEPNYQSSFDTIRRALEALPND
jgi:hypothetical protein